MSDAIVFWLAKPLAELLMAAVMVVVIGAVMVVGTGVRKLDNWIDKQRRSS